MVKRTLEKALVAAVEKAAIPLEGGTHDYDQIVRAARGRQFVLIGEATHGTAEFYRARALITQSLIREEGFDAVAAEADWPPATRINRYVAGYDRDGTAEEALGDFDRFPAWMWRNVEVARFIDWLRAYNSQFRPSGDELLMPVGFYGLDLYSLRASVAAVVAYLDRVDPAEARRARERYSCLDHFMQNPHAYGYAAESSLADSCEDDIIAQLVEMQRHAYDYIRQENEGKNQEYFSARQNARLIRNAEQYYRAVFRGRPNSWNLRDRHMFETLEDLADHLGSRLGRDARIVVWAHNSHVGNAAATEMADSGEHNIGQLVRQKYGTAALLIGFSTSHGTVTAAENWDDPFETMAVSDPYPGSCEDLFRHASPESFFLDLRQYNDATIRLLEPRLQRAIGVVYRPRTERESHYLYVRLPVQFDFMIHFDRTSALRPLEAALHAHTGELDETYPYGL